MSRSTIFTALQIPPPSSNISHAETEAPSVTPNTPLSISRPEAYQASSIWSSFSTSILPKPEHRRAQQILHGASPWRRPRRDTPLTAGPTSSGSRIAIAVVWGEAYKVIFCHTVSATSSLKSRHVRSSAAPHFSHIDLLDLFPQCAIPSISSIRSADVGPSSLLNHARKASISAIVPLSRMA